MLCSFASLDCRALGSGADAAAGARRLGGCKKGDLLDEASHTSHTKRFPRTYHPIAQDLEDSGRC